MKKLLCISGLAFCLYNFFESLAFDLLPALASSETIAYKAGFTVGIFLIFLAAIGYACWTYDLFTDTPSNHSNATA